MRQSLEKTVGWFAFQLGAMWMAGVACVMSLIAVWVATTPKQVMVFASIAILTGVWTVRTYLWIQRNTR